MRGQSGTITAVVNALAKAGIELGENSYASPKIGVHPRPVVDLVGIEPELLAYIIKTETGEA